MSALLAAAATLSGAFVASSGARAADLFWDANADGAGTGGAGEWFTPSDPAGNWRDGSATGTLGTWSDGNNGVFGGTSGVVVVDNFPTVTGLQFTTGGYQLAGAGINLSGPAIIALGSGSGGITTNIFSNLSATELVSINKGTTGGATLNLIGDHGFPAGNTFSGGIAINGAMTLSLWSPNDFTGGIAVNAPTRINVNPTDTHPMGNPGGSMGTGSGAGTVSVSGDASNSIFTNSNGLGFANGVTTTVIENDFVLNTTGVAGFQSAFAATGGNGGSYELNFSGDISTSTAVPGATSDVIISNTVTSGGNVFSAAITTFSGNNTYNGATYINNSVNGAGSMGIFKIGSATALPSTTSLTFGRNSSHPVGAMDMNGFDVTVTSLATNLSGSGSAVGITNTSATPVTLTVNGSDNTTYASKIGAILLRNAGTEPMNEFPGNDGIALTRGGTGNLTLTGANTYTGPTTINGGTLTLANTAADTHTIVSNTTVNSGGTLASAADASAGTGGSVTLNHGAQVQPGGAGAVGILRIDNGLTLNGAASDPLASLVFDLASSINYDQLDLGSSTLTLNDLSEIELVGTAAPSMVGTYTLATYAALAGSGSIDTAGFATPGPYQYILNAGANALTLEILPTSATYAWDIGGGGGPIVEGAGTWVNGSTDFTDLSTDTGVVWNNADNVPVTFGNDVNASGGTITLAGDIRAGGRLLFGPINPDAAYVIGDAGSSNTLTFGGGVIASSNANINAPVILETSQSWAAADGATLTVNGNINDGAGGAKSITKTDAGTIRLNGTANTFSGGLTINAGTVEAFADAALGAGAITIDGSGATLGFISDGASNIYSIGKTIVIGADGGTIRVAGGVVAAVTSDITGAGVLNKTGNGALGLSGNNTFASLTVSNGAVGLFSDANLGAGDLTLAGGSLQAQGDWSSNKNFILTGTGGTDNRLDTQGFSVTLNGQISGPGALRKLGAGTLYLPNANTFEGATIFSNVALDGSAVTEGGTIRTNHLNALGSGGMNVNANGTLHTDTDLQLDAAIRGTSRLTKTGPGTLFVGGTAGANAGASLLLSQGKVQMNSSTALGGANAGTTLEQAAMDVTLEEGTELVINWGGARRDSGSYILNGGDITRLAGATGENTLTNYNSGTDFGDMIQVTGDSTISHMAIATAQENNNLAFNHPVVVESGGTLTTFVANNMGYDGGHTIAFRGVPAATFPADAFTIKPGGAVITSGPGQTRFGRNTSQGKVIVGQGTSAASNAVMTLGANTYMNDITNAATHVTHFAVQGAGDGGLRIESAMNATYVDRSVDADETKPDGTTGLFGVNTTSTGVGGTPPTGFGVIGSAHTVATPTRLAKLSDSFNGVDPSGTLTLAANDPAGATGTIDAGPAAAAAVALALDNTPTSGNLIYQIDPAGNGGTFGNFSKLTVQRSNTSAGEVTAQLLGVTKVPSVAIAATARLDITDHKLITTDAPGTADSTGTYTGLQREVQRAYNFTNWDQPGLMTSMPDAKNGLTTIGISTGKQIRGLGETDTALWAGQTITGASTLAMYTYAGDANLDGQIDAGDYGIIDNFVQIAGASGYGNGDFNYDGFIDAGDYGIIDNNIQAQTTPFPTSGSLEARVAGLPGVTAVPEPSACGLALLGAAELLRRRRRSGSSM